MESYLNSLNVRETSMEETDRGTSSHSRSGAPISTVHRGRIEKKSC